MKELLKKKAKVYKKKYTDREAFEQQYDVRLKVVDYCGAVKTVAHEQEMEDDNELIDKLFSFFRDWRLGTLVYELFDEKKYNVSVSIQSQESSQTARVEITKRRRLAELIERIEKDHIEG